jgi:hypothetical protein
MQLRRRVQHREHARVVRVLVARFHRFSIGRSAGFHHIDRRQVPPLSRPFAPVTVPQPAVDPRHLRLLLSATHERVEPLTGPRLVAACLPNSQPSPKAVSFARSVRISFDRLSGIGTVCSRRRLSNSFRHVIAGGSLVMSCQRRPRTAPIRRPVASTKTNASSSRTHCARARLIFASAARV